MPASLTHRLLPLLALAGCATGEADDGLLPPGRGGAPDALVSGGDGGPGPGGSTARLLFFRVGADGYVAAADGTGATVICPGGTPYPDDDGGRALCIPDDTSAPLSLYDTAARTAIAEYPGWRPGRTGRPQLAPDGGKVAFVAENDEGLFVARLADDGGHAIGEVEALDVVAFPGPETLVVDFRRPSVWRPGAEPVPIDALMFSPVGPEPAGVVHASRDGGGVFLDAATRQLRGLGAGAPGGVHGTRVLLVDPLAAEARIVDLADPLVDHVVPLPDVRFDQILGTALAGPAAALLRFDRLETCADGVIPTARTTQWYGVALGETRVVANTDPASHAAYVDHVGTRALVLDVDPCGLPIGTGKIRDLATGADQQLTAFVPGRVHAGAVSTDGRYVALGHEQGLSVVDFGATPPATRVVVTGDRTGEEVWFR